MQKLIPHTVMNDEIKLLPQGINDFARIRRENYYYVDKSAYIEKIERDSSYMLIVRPRRFGKSLFLSMLESYYDVKAKNDFDMLFSGLYIGEHPTKWRNYYRVISLDFSQVSCEYDNLTTSFYKYCNNRLDEFAMKYEDMYYPGFAADIKNEDFTSEKINMIARRAKMYGNHLYLILDEYDNFTNTVWTLKGENIYKSITHGEGFYRDVFKKFKGNFDRIFITGVSPVTLDDLTSGFNIAEYASNFPEYNQMFGFSENDVREMVKYYISAGLIKADGENFIDDFIEIMRPWCNNYCFSYDSFNENEPKMFNGMITTYYISHYITKHKFPEDMYVPNAMIDYPKLDHLIRLEKDNENLRRNAIIMKIIDNGFVYENIIGHFPASEVVNLRNFISLLYYYGMLTITGTRGVSCKLSIPNNNVRMHYYRYLQSEYDKYLSVDNSELRASFDNAAIDGNYKEMLTFIAVAYKNASVNRNSIEGERTIQGFYMAYLGMNPYYLMKPEIELAHGYGDIFLLPDKRFNFVNHCYLVEFKYVKTTCEPQDETDAFEAAKAQLAVYSSDKQIVKMIGSSKLHKIVMIFKGGDLVRLEEVF
ncbi:MAG: AAA family ATPase [Bacteroidales bacterium]|nr:AAA family ATPase [Bacteroidales bacterium]